MIAAGVARKLVFSWLGNPGVGGLGAIRRRIEGEIPAEPLEVEEYSHFGMVGRYTAGAMNLPFFPLRSYFETDLPVANPLIRPIASPYGDETIYAVPPLRPDVTIVHAQRASAAGDTQVWGLLGCQKEAAFAADRVIVVVEELVDEEVIRADPNRTIIPGLIVDAVVVEPWGAHPSYVQGAYDRDNRFYLDWDAITRDEAATQAWLREWVYDLDGRAAYVEKLGAERRSLAEPGLGAVGLGRLRGVPLMAATVRYLVADVDRAVAFYVEHARVRAGRADGTSLRPGPARRPDAVAARPGELGRTTDARRRAAGGRRLEPVRHRGRRPASRGRGDARSRRHVPQRDRERTGRQADPRRGPRRQPDRAVRGAPMTAEPLMILVAGPVPVGDGRRSGAHRRPTSAAMTEVALELYRRGHLPVMGEWFALPLIEEARRLGDDPGRRRRDLPPGRRAPPGALRRVPADRRPVRGRGPDGRHGRWRSARPSTTTSEDVP